MVSKILKIIVVSLLLTAQTTVQWDANTEADLAGYKLYCCKSSDCQVIGASFISLASTLTSYEYTGNGVGADYCKITAFDNSANEAIFSDEVVLPDNIPPTQVRGLAVVSVGP